MILSSQRQAGIFRVLMTISVC